MSDRSFEGLHDLLPTGAGGDVLAARLTARQLVTPAGGEIPDLIDPILATLVLTAICLHAAAEIAGDVRRADVTHYLKSMLETGMPEPALFRSPMQFVRYAAAELRAVPAKQSRSLLRALIAAIALGTPSQ